MLNWIRSKLGATGGAHESTLRDAEAALKSGQTERARAACLAVLREAPEEIRALCMLASIAADERRLEEGLGFAEQAIAVDPESAAAHYAAGRLWEGAARYDRAEASYRRVVNLDPSHAKAHNNLGVAHYMQGKFDAAIACYRRALELDPQQAEANQNLAGILGDPGARQTALEGFERQVAANPRDAAAYGSLSALCIQTGRHGEALAHLDRAIALEPERAEFHFAKSHLLLLLGDYERGWKEYEWRWRVSAFNAPALRFKEPMWDGGPVAGPLLIHGETGLGDTLLFVRYARLAAERGIEVIVECQPRLKPLLEGVEGIAQLVAQGEALPPFAAHIPLIGLPVVFGTTLDTIPWNGPYLRPSADRKERWAALVGPRTGLRVGLAWAGNPATVSDRERSTTLAALAPLARVKGVTFYSLQKRAPGAKTEPVPEGMKLVDLTGEERDFGDTAALISHLDVVVAVDSSMTQLAAASGAPTWVLVAYDPDWKWLLAREDSPWYPSVRVFRQEREGDWSAPIERIARALESYTPV